MPGSTVGGMSATWRETTFDDRTEWTRMDRDDPRTIIEFRNRPRVWHIDEGNGLSHGEFNSLAEAQEHVEQQRPILRPRPGSMEAPGQGRPHDPKAVTD